eukprot:1012435-Amphidinium_carterae.1
MHVDACSKWTVCVFDAESLRRSCSLESERIKAWPNSSKCQQAAAAYMAQYHQGYFTEQRQQSFCASQTAQVQEQPRADARPSYESMLVVNIPPSAALSNSLARRLGCRSGRCVLHIKLILPQTDHRQKQAGLKVQTIMRNERFPCSDKIKMHNCDGCPCCLLLSNSLQDRQR